MPKLDWSGDKQTGFSTEYNDMFLYMKVRGNKFAGLALDYNREQVGGGWFISVDGSVVENELIQRCGGNPNELTSDKDTESNTSKSSLENLFTVTPETEDTLNKIRNAAENADKIYCNICKKIVEEFNNKKKLCDECFDRYELPVNENICIMCREEYIDPAKIKITYINSENGFLVCVDCWSRICVITRNLPSVNCIKCNDEFRPCNHYEYLFKTCSSPEGYCASLQQLKYPIKQFVN